MDQIIESRTLDSVWDAIESHLVSLKRAATSEIRSYPQPIAGCDAQIPALWERRDGIVAELERLSAARRGSRIDDFIGSSRYIDDEKKREFLARAV